MQYINLPYYSNIILNSFSILLLPKLCYHIGWHGFKFPYTKIHLFHYSTSLYIITYVTFVTGPAIIGHICTQNLALILKFNLQYILKYKSYDNEIFLPYSQINKKANKVYRTWISYAQTKKSTIFWRCVICADMPCFRRPSHILWCIVRHTSSWSVQEPLELVESITIILFSFLSKS